MAVPYHIEKKNYNISWKNLTKRLGVGLFFGGILALVIRIFIVEPIQIESSSMEPTFIQGNSYYLKKWKNSYQIGDVVLCKKKSGSIIARIIGEPGDYISIQSKVVFRNGESIPIAAYPIQFKDNRPPLPNQLTPRDNMDAIQIPENHYFLLGDNRDIAMDSRLLGSLPKDCLSGKFSE